MLTPIRSAIVVPNRRSSSSFNDREPRLHLERRPARAQRVVLVRLRHAEHRHTASPMNFSTVPPCRSSAPRISWKYESISSRTASASTRSPIAVDPDRSQNTSVASFRRSDGRRRQRGAAVAAVAEALGVLTAAGRTGEHCRKPTTSAERDIARLASPTDACRCFHARDRRVRLFLHELRTEQVLFWRNREAAFFTFFLPVIFFLVFGSIYGKSVITKEHHSRRHRSCRRG